MSKTLNKKYKDEQKIVIMNFAAPPSLEDIEAIAQAHVDNLPSELCEYCEEITLEVEELPDEGLETDLDLDSPFDIFALYKRGAEISPGIISKTSCDEDTLLLFRRSLLDYWCESYEDLTAIIRRVVITEIGQQFDFTEDEIEDMLEREVEVDYPEDLL